MNSCERNLEYYKHIDKVFWVPVDDIKLSNGNIIKQNERIPCIFVEKKNDKYFILQFDLSIEFDEWRYTAWRKVIGQIYNIRVEVLLINGNGLFELNGSEIKFEELGHSNVLVDKKYLAKCDLKIQYPSFIKNGYYIVSAEKYAKKYITFEIPPLHVRYKLHKGKYAKLIFKFEANIEQNNGIAVERMWVKIINSKNDYYIGKLKNIPIAETKVLKFNQEIIFHPKHIIDVC